MILAQAVFGVLVGVMPISGPVVGAPNALGAATRNDRSDPNEVLKAIQTRWSSARSLEVSIARGAHRARLRGAPGQVLHIEVEQRASDPDANQPRRFVLGCDGRRMREVDVERQQWLEGDVDPKRGPTSQVTCLSHCQIPYLAAAGEPSYWDRLLTHGDLTRARFVSPSEHVPDAVRSIAVPCNGETRIQELRLALDGQSRVIRVFQVLGTNANGQLYGPNWRLDDLKLSTSPSTEGALALKIPSDARQVSYSAFDLPRVGAKAPEFELSGLDGETLSLAAARGSSEAVLLQFWGSWCGPCRREMPHIEDLYQEYAEQGLSVLGIACSDQADAARRAVKQTGVTYPNALDQGGSGSVDAMYGVRSFPTLILVGKTGVVLWHSHDAAEVDLEAAIRAAVSDR